MKVKITYEEAHKSYPKEVEAAFNNFKKSKSKYKDVPIDKLKWSYEFGLTVDPMLIASIMKIVKSGGFMQVSTQSNIDAAFCHLACQANSRSSVIYHKLTIIPFEVFAHYVSDDRAEYRKWLKFKNFK